MNTSAKQPSASSLFISDDIKRAIRVHLLNLEHFQYEEIKLKVDQIVGPSKPLRGIKNAHGYLLAEWLETMGISRHAAW